MFLNLVYPVTVYLVSPTAWNSVLVGGLVETLVAACSPKCNGGSAWVCLHSFCSKLRHKSTDVKGQCHQKVIIPKLWVIWRGSMYSKTLTTYVFSLIFCIEMKYVLHVFAFKQGSDCLTLCHLLYLRHLKKKIFYSFIMPYNCFYAILKSNQMPRPGRILKKAIFLGLKKIWKSIR